MVTLESALSKQKEDELIALEERYEESYKFKKSLKEKEQELEEMQRGSRECQREAKEARMQLEKREKVR